MESIFCLWKIILKYNIKLEKQLQIISVKLNELSQIEHTHVTAAQDKKYNITSTPKAPLYFQQPLPFLQRNCLLLLKPYTAFAHIKNLYKLNHNRKFWTIWTG